MKEEMVRSGARRSAGRGWRRILVSRSFDDTRVVPSTSKLTTSDPTRTGDMGHVKHVSPVRRKSLEAVRGAVQVQDGHSYWSHGRFRTQGGQSISKLATRDPTRTGDSGHVSHVSPVQRKRWRAVRGAVKVHNGGTH